MNLRDIVKIQFLDKNMTFDTVCSVTICNLEVEKKLRLDLNVDVFYALLLGHKTWQKLHLNRDAFFLFKASAASAASF